MKNVLWFLGWVAPWALAAPLPTIDNFSPERWAGHWYEIARLPNFFQRHCRASELDYTLRDDGRLAVAAICHQQGKTSIAHGLLALNEQNPRSGALEISFFRPFWGKFSILAAPNFRAALVGSEDRAHLWLLSRAPTLPENIHRQFLKQAQALGFAVSQLHYDQHQP